MVDEDTTDPRTRTRERGRGATITDVARIAGVSPSTVSRALSAPDRVHHTTRRRVEDAAAQLAYVPSGHARSLASGRTSNIAVLVPDMTNPFFFDIIRGTQRQLRAAGYTQLLVDTEESTEVERAAIDAVLKTSDGVVLAASRLDADELRALAAQRPLVTINRDVPEVPGVVIDTPSGMVQALQHLHSLGHRRVAYIAGPDGSWSNARRWAALETEAERLGVSLHRSGPWPPTFTSGAAAADQSLGLGVTACIAFNDLIAIGMLRRLHERGVDVPREMSVIGCDDGFGSDFAHPPLTTVTAPIEEAGRVATTMLLEQTRPHATSPHRQRAILRTHLTVRASSGPAPTPETP